MKIAYLILAHKEPKQLYNMIEKLHSKDVHFFVHIDTKSNFNDFNKLLNNKNHISHYSKFRTSWGSFSLVKSELFLLKKAFEWGAKRYVLLSGQDYPIKSFELITLFFEKNKDVGFIEGKKIPDLEWSEHQNGLFRINRFHFQVSGTWKAFPPHTKKPILKKLFNLLARGYFNLFIKNEKIKEYYHGGQWWALTNEQVDYVLRNADYTIRKFKHSYVSDEIFIQTILYNAPDGMFNLHNHNLHFIKWPFYSSSPEVLTLKYHEELLDSEKLFARKFELPKSEQLILKLNTASSIV